MAAREYFQGDSGQDSYEFVGRRGPNSRSTSPYPPAASHQGHNSIAGNDPYASNYGGQSQNQSQYPPQPQSPYRQDNSGGSGSSGYNRPAPPARYDPNSSSNYNSPPPAYGQHDPYSSGYGQHSGGGSSLNGQQGYNQQRPQDYPEHNAQSRLSGQPAYGQQDLSHGPGPGQEGGPGGAQGDERGFMGAVAGAAAGGYGGHKMNHGILGTVGGAVAGSMIQDHFKHEKKEKEEKKKQEERAHQQQMRIQQQQQQQAHQQQMQFQQQQQYGGFMHGGPPPQHHNQQNWAGNFSHSSGDISLDRDYDLIARCGDCNGGHKLTSINLNDYITNEFGNLKWMKGGNFGGSSRNVRLADGGRVLEAECGDGGGGWKRSFIYLDEHIGNDNGDLKYCD